ncbi:MAG: gamma-glutamylcyclotransferase, partial [Paracoccaceae bacterium]
ATCSEVAFLVAAVDAEAALAGLRERELVSSAYLEEVHPLRLQNGETVDAICYVVDRDHVQYCGGIDLEKQARIIARAHGGRGSNAEYLYNTAQHLREIGLGDEDLDWLEARVRALL